MTQLLPVRFKNYYKLISKNIQINSILRMSTAINVSLLLSSNGRRWRRCGVFGCDLHRHKYRISKAWPPGLGILLWRRRGGDSTWPMNRALKSSRSDPQDADGREITGKSTAKKSCLKHEQLECSGQLGDVLLVQKRAGRTMKCS